MLHRRSSCRFCSPVASQLRVHRVISRSFTESKICERGSKTKPESSKPTSKNGTTSGDSSAKTGPTWATLQEKLRKGVQPPPSATPKATLHAETRRAAAAIPLPVRKKSRRLPASLEVVKLHPHRLELQPIEDGDKPDPPRLSHGLDRVLFNPGVYELRDQRSGVFNFDPYLSSLMPNDDFDFDALGDFVTSSEDARLLELTKKHKKKYFTSTSSSTAILSHFHFLLSGWRPPNFDTLSKTFRNDSKQFTAITRGPAAAFLRYKDGAYALDADKQFDTENVLSLLGKSMEKLLTLPKDEYELYRRDQSHRLSDEVKQAGEAYHYTTLGDFVLRSQLDAHDPRLPGTGVFDLKTRAVVSIRMDVRGYEKGLGYEIWKRLGQWSSFEREYYDMIRAAFLKYSLQVRMGRMDGIFVAYHNTQRIFGFQYISLEEMDEVLHGTRNKRVGDGEFKASIKIFNDLLDRATAKFPGKTLRIRVETRPTKVPLLYFFAEPVEDAEVDRIQAKNADSAKRLGRELMDLNQKAAKAVESSAAEEASPETAEAEDNSDLDADHAAVWEEMMSQVDDALDDESRGAHTVRQAVREALDQRGLLADRSEVEVEQELDALVEALTAEASAGNRIQESNDSVEEAIETDAEESEESVVKGDILEAAKLETDIATAQTDEDAGIATEESDESNAEDRAEDPATNATQSFRNMSLSDLILRATQDATVKTEDLRAFELAFARLLVRSKGEKEEKVAESDDAKSPESAPEPPKKELLGLYVTVRNQVNEQYAVRPEPHHEDDNFTWRIDYNVGEMPASQSHKIYAQVKGRRKKLLQSDPLVQSQRWHAMYKGQLPRLTKDGVKQRKMVAEQDRKRGKLFGAWSQDALKDSPSITDAIEPTSQGEGASGKT